MTKLILAGAAALALSTGIAFAANAQPRAAQSTADYGNVSAQDAPSNQHYSYLSQQPGNAPGQTAQDNSPQGSYGPVVSHPFNDWIGP